MSNIIDFGEYRQQNEPVAVETTETQINDNEEYVDLLIPHVESILYAMYNSGINIKDPKLVHTLALCQCLTISAVRHQFGEIDNYTDLVDELLSRANLS